MRFTLPSVRHLLNYCPGMVSTHPAPSPQVLLAAHECHNNPCRAQPMHQQITRAVALERVAAPRKTAREISCCRGSAREKAPNCAAEPWLRVYFWEAKKRGLGCLTKQRKKPNGSSVCGFGANTGLDGWVWVRQRATEELGS